MAKLYEAGYDTVEKILKMSVADFKGVPGFQNTLSVKIWTSIQEKTGQATLVDWAVASGKMGRGLGKKKLALILETHPEIVKEDTFGVIDRSAPLRRCPQRGIDGRPPKGVLGSLKDDGQTDAQKINLLQTIHGIGPENATEFVKGLPAFRAFMNNRVLVMPQNEVSHPINKPVVSIMMGPLNGKKIVMSKIRDKRNLEEMSKQGATMEDRVNQNTFALIVPSKEETSNKVKDAQKHGVPIMDSAEFTAK